MNNVELGAASTDVPARRLQLSPLDASPSSRNSVSLARAQICSSSRDEVKMAGLGAAKPIVVVCTSDRIRAATFYRDTLGLTLTSEDRLATAFDVGGTAMHISTVADFTPHEHT